MTLNTVADMLEEVDSTLTHLDRMLDGVNTDTDPESSAIARQHLLNAYNSMASTRNALVAYDEFMKNRTMKLTFHQLEVYESGARFHIYYTVSMSLATYNENYFDTTAAVLDSMDAWVRLQVVGLNVEDRYRESVMYNPNNHLTHIDTWVDHAEVF